jgi:hypothetical protein
MKFMWTLDCQIWLWFAVAVAWPGARTNVYPCPVTSASSLKPVVVAHFELFLTAPRPSAMCRATDTPSRPCSQLGVIQQVRERVGRFHG